MSSPCCHCRVAVVGLPGRQDWDQQPLQSGGTSRPGHLLLRGDGQSERSNQVSVELKGFSLSTCLSDGQVGFLFFFLPAEVVLLFLFFLFFSFSHSVRCQSGCQTSRRAHDRLEPIMCSSSQCRLVLASGFFFL